MFMVYITVMNTCGECLKGLYLMGDGRGAGSELLLIVGVHGDQLLR